MKNVIAVDLDKTLAHQTIWKGKDHIGEPIPAMMDRVKKWISDGVSVVIFTARADKPEHIPPIREWLKKHLGQPLPVTNIKRKEFSEFWDDRAVKVQANTGRILSRGVKNKARRMAVRA
jgi:hypothetical protein